jgi:hypothetical protein
MVKDFKEAAWALLPALFAKKGVLHLEAVCVHPEKTVLLKYLVLMNIPLRMDNHRWVGDQPVADFHIMPPKKLLPVRVNEADMPALTETLPVLLEVAARADGTSLIPHTPESAALLKGLTPRDNYFHIEGSYHV